MEPSTVTTNQEAIPTKPCTVCNKPIEAAKLRIHEATCARNNFKCSKCGEIVAKAEKDHHESEVHTVVKCNFCNEFESEKSLIKDHQYTCPNRPMKCQFCEMQFPGSKYFEHEGYCGSKTRKCPDCKQNITLRDYEGHKENGACNFHQEIESGKIQRELQKFQEEEAMKLKQRQLIEEKKQRERKEEQYIQSTLPKVTRNAEPQIVNYSDGRQYIKKPTQPSSSSTAPQVHTAPVEEHPPNTDEDLDAAMIQRMLQEDLDQEEAKKYQEGSSYGVPNSGFNESPARNLPPGVRRGDEQFEDQLIGSFGNTNFGGIGLRGRGYGPGAIPYSGGEHQGGGAGFTTSHYNEYRPDGTWVQQTTSYSNVIHPPRASEPIVDYEGDSEMQNDFDDEETIMRRVMEESKRNAGGAVSAAQPHPSTGVAIDETEEELLRHIIEQSKNEK